MPGHRHVQLAFIAATALLLAATGCTQQTGLMVEIAGPNGTTSTAAGVTTLEFVVAHPSFCERWISDATANLTRIDVAERDLAKQPYDFLLKPTHQTDLSQPVYIAALAFAADGQLLGEAAFAPLPFAQGQVLKRRARLQLFGAASQPDGPKYVTGDNCVCVPGQPWVGNGSGMGCDTQVITSFARLGDTAGCELTPKGAPLPVPVCDGQLYGDESDHRTLPCFAVDGAGACRVTTRVCVDQDGTAYGSECNTGAADTQMPSATLCARYRQCQQSPCGDLVGCFEHAFPARRNVACTLRIDPNTDAGEPIQPCGGGGGGGMGGTSAGWKAELPGGAATSPCIAAVIEGTAQLPFVLGLTAAMESMAQPLSVDCPTTLQVDSIDAPYPMAVPATKELDLVVGEELVHVTISVLRECNGGPALVCTPA